MKKHTSTINFTEANWIQVEGLSKMTGSTRTGVLNGILECFFDIYTMSGISEEILPMGEILKRVFEEASGGTISTTFPDEEFHHENIDVENNPHLPDSEV